MKAKSLFSMFLGSTVMFFGAAQAGGLGDLAGGGAGSFASGSAGNAAGVIEFCVKNNYLSGDAAGSMKDKLMGKAGIGKPETTDDGGFGDGAKGLLKTGDGKSVDLAGMGGLKKSMTKKACDSVLDNAKSLL
jgi:hypothetical protein